MSAFPTISSTFTDFPQDPVDDTIDSTSEAGYKQTRPRFTRAIRVFGPCKLIVNSTDNATLIAFDATVKGSSIFTISHPITAEVLNVRFKKDGRLKSEPILGTNPGDRQFSIEFMLEEA